MSHYRFISRTILCRDNNVDQTVKSLQKVLVNEGIIRTSKRWESYEKPFERRNRLSFEKCREIYNDEMNKKVQFIIRKNRVNPYPWE
jgi:small subunit ribosomal protein S21